MVVRTLPQCAKPHSTSSSSYKEHLQLNYNTLQHSASTGGMNLHLDAQVKLETIQKQLEQSVLALLEFS